MGTSIPLLMDDGLRRNAWKFPVKIAAKDKFRAITYGELNQRANQFANGLLSAGVRRGDAVALSVGNRIEHLEILFATAKIGALAIPLDVKWKALELASVIAALEPRFIILQEDCAVEFEKAKTLKKLDFLEAHLALRGSKLRRAAQRPERRRAHRRASMRMIPSRSCSRRERRGFPRDAWRRSEHSYFIASTTPSRRAWARMIRRSCRRRFISMRDDRLRSESFISAGR